MRIQCFYGMNLFFWLLSDLLNEPYLLFYFYDIDEIIIINNIQSTFLKWTTIREYFMKNQLAIKNWVIVNIINSFWGLCANLRLCHFGCLWLFYVPLLFVWLLMLSRGDSIFQHFHFKPFYNMVPILLVEFIWTNNIIGYSQLCSCIVDLHIYSWILYHSCSFWFQLKLGWEIIKSIC